MSQKCLLCQNQIDSQVSIQNILSILAHHVSTICSQCSQQFSELIPGCMNCGKVGILKNQRCNDCQLWHQNGLDLINQSIYQYNEFMSKYMHRYKFQGDYRLRAVFKDQFNQRIKKLARHRLVVPIPISKATWHSRGFNQVIGWLDVDYADALIVEKKIRQSSLTRTQRLSMKQPFSVHPDWQNQLVGQDVLLVDDVYTTGTTLHLATQKLIEVGCHSVISFTLSR